MKKTTFVLFYVAAAALLAFNVEAVPIPGDLSITGSADFDEGFALADPGVSQSGDYSATEGGVATTNTINGATVTGADPLPATFTNTGDGFGLNIVSSTDGAVGEFAFGIDFSIDLANNSATDTFQIFFGLDFMNSVDANGADAFADSELTLDQDALEIFFSDIVSEILFAGDQNGGVPLGTFGDMVSDSGAFAFDLTLAPGDIANLLMDYTLIGGNFVSGGDAFAALNASLDITDVINLTSPIPVPEPGTLSLLGIGLIGLFGLRRKRVK